ncbi:DUF418 domain-containing protein [Streptomyces sp. 3214.6]|uniref:DUF418 domain-containing protein n=1 Tax=Streptomyces sp. 3214.6 TaxID=1882757 RepID=UPI0022B25451|nr:DUF418 domain-containing protein [Streptomyces sp. 3214.6]
MTQNADDTVLTAPISEQAAEQAAEPTAAMATASVAARAGAPASGRSSVGRLIDAFPRFHRLARPVVAVGTMSLTAYVFHIVGIRLLGIEELPGSSPHVLLGFLVAVTVFAALWSRFFRRGPLEWLLGKATKPAGWVR